MPIAHVEESWHMAEFYSNKVWRYDSLSLDFKLLCKSDMEALICLLLIA